MTSIQTIIDLAAEAKIDMEAKTKAGAVRARKNLLAISKICLALRKEIIAEQKAISAAK